MRFRKRQRNADKFEPKTAALIDVVFLLLIFFMLSLKITAKEGDLNLNMPLASGGGDWQTIRVKLLANDDGSLANVLFNHKPLGTGEAAFQKLSEKVSAAVGMRNGKPLNADVDIEIEADYNLDYQYAVKALSACTGRMEKSADGESRLVRYVEKIRFAPPRKAD